MVLIDVATKKTTMLAAPKGIFYGVDAAWMPDSHHLLVVYGGTTRIAGRWAAFRFPAVNSSRSRTI